MALSAIQLKSAAQFLAQAEMKRNPVDQLTRMNPDITIEDAYQIQTINIRRRVSEGATVKGHKVGLSSKAMQEMMGVHEPDFGHLLDDMFYFEQDTISIDRFLQPRIEIETAFVLGAQLPAPGCTAADVLRCTEFLCPAIELIDSRIRDWNIQLCDTIADNASSGGVILGGNATPITAVDPRTIDAELFINDQRVAAGRSDAVLGNPVTAVAWLANKLHTFGVTLDAGHVILPGSCTRAFEVKAGDHVRAEFSTLGPVEVRFA